MSLIYDNVKLRFPDIGHEIQRKGLMIVPEKTVQRDLQPVLLVEMLQVFLVEMVKRVFRPFLGEIGEEKAVVVDEEAVSLERFLVPHQRQLLAESAVGRQLGDRHLVDFLPEFDFGGKMASVHLRPALRAPAATAPTRA